ncbi:PilT protein domain protein [Thermaerobacter marianensis DSM 12885]|uniref:PilT protein domain protein n=1 Tax=Thermaerobacter marianensis (strain ATCC 700841 / DSM 12885 / JCM 10246 / 7p75a) TaxID=644966 RepID=E6SLF3_THEM7|nr:PIN domain-containing protein [Thermaerobacter marianensis]ADU52395.1 PilT protein domain protein [Thermaerobacter marianensis DSM 12885]
MRLRSIRLAFAVLGALGGFGLAYYGLLQQESLRILAELPRQWTYGLMVLFLLLGGLGGYAAALRIWQQVVQFTQWVEARLVRTPIQDTLAGVLGLIAGLVIANLLSGPLGLVPVVGPLLPPIFAVLLAYLGAVVAVKRRDDLAHLLAALARPGRERERERERERNRERERPAPPPGSYKVLDTSAIIDGRIADVVATGFLEGTLVVPGFVLEELRRIADSADTLRRNRGRRGLEILRRIQQESPVPVEIYEGDVEGDDVDSKLLRLARRLNGKVVTNDYNLNQIAGLQGVPVLNVNELANAVKPVVLPGEAMEVQIIREGKEAGQGVGFLDDGTMIVVEGGKRYIGQRIDVEVSTVLQTAAGRMIFARPKVMGRAAP